MDLYQLIGPTKEPINREERNACEHWNIGKTWFQQVIVRKLARKDNLNFIDVEIVVSPKNFAPNYDQKKQLRIPNTWLKKIE